VVRCIRARRSIHGLPRGYGSLCFRENGVAVTVRFWGVRGSIPTPLTPEQVRRKIASVVQRIENKDIESQESRERFLARLPDYLFGTIGGNTTCLEVRLDDGTMIVFDAGSGIRELGAQLKNRRDTSREYHLFFSHFHWDHLQGLPFFAPLFDPAARVHFYSEEERFEEYLRGQMRYPYFPVTLDVMAAELEFHVLTGTSMTVAGSEVSWRKVKHPGGCRSYSVREGEHKIVFSTDTELSEDDFKKTGENLKFYRNTDIVIMDSQYTLGEAIEKYDWGHSSYSLAVDFASEWNISNLVLFHHEPLYDDQKMHNILKSASWYLGHLEHQGVRVSLAREGLEFSL
jgi:phosphoribosyl 1,2-cyclic phosphodiesterase